MLPPNAVPLTYDEFRKLEVGDAVISKQLGAGVVAELYEKDQVIIRFRERRVRIPIDNHDLMRVSQSTERRRQRTRVRSGDSSMSLGQFKRQQKAVIKNEYVTILEAAKAIGISKAKLEQRINKRKIEVRSIAGASRISMASMLMLLSD